MILLKKRRNVRTVYFLSICKENQYLHQDIYAIKIHLNRNVRGCLAAVETTKKKKCKSNGRFIVNL
jgi:hypothetical protein